MYIYMYIIYVSPFIPHSTLFSHLPKMYPIPTLYRNHDARIGVPAQQRVLAVLRRRVLDVGPVLEEFLLAEHARQVARKRTVDVFHEGEVGGEEDIEVALLNLSGDGKRVLVKEEEGEG